MKLVLLCLTSASLACFTWFILLALDAIHYNLGKNIICAICAFSSNLKGKIHMLHFRKRPEFAENIRI